MGDGRTALRDKTRGMDVLEDGIHKITSKTLLQYISLSTKEKQLVNQTIALLLSQQSDGR